MGREELIGDARYDSPDERTKRREEVDTIVSDWTRKHDKHEAMNLVGAATIPSGAVMDTMELANDQTFVQRGIRQVMHHPQIGDYTMSGWPVRFSGETLPIKAAPLLGQHNAEVLEDWLGMDNDKIGGLRNDAVIVARIMTQQTASCRTKAASESSR